MKSQFTPGPWKTEVLGSTIRVVEDTGQEFEDDLIVIGNCAVNKHIGNARLICAAPELLAALETLTEWMLSYTGPADGTRGMLVTAQDAITKSKGA